MHVHLLILNMTAIGHTHRNREQQSAEEGEGLRHRQRSVHAEQIQQRAAEEHRDDAADGVSAAVEGLALQEGIPGQDFCDVVHDGGDEESIADELKQLRGVNRLRRARQKDQAVFHKPRPAGEDQQPLVPEPFAEAAEQQHGGEFQNGRDGGSKTVFRAAAAQLLHDLQHEAAVHHGVKRKTCAGDQKQQKGRAGQSGAVAVKAVVAPDGGGVIHFRHRQQKINQNRPRIDEK